MINHCQFYNINETTAKAGSLQKAHCDPQPLKIIICICRRKQAFAVSLPKAGRNEERQTDSENENQYRKKKEIKNKILRRQVKDDDDVGDIAGLTKLSKQLYRTNG